MFPAVICCNGHGKDGQGLKLDKGGQTFSSLIIMPTKLTKNTVIVFISLKEHFVYAGVSLSIGDRRILRLLRIILQLNFNEVWRYFLFR